MSRARRKTILHFSLLCVAMISDQRCIAQSPCAIEEKQSPPPYKVLRYDEDYSYLKDPGRPAGGSNARYVGNSPSLTLAWNPTRHVAVIASYVHLLPGQFLRDNPPSKSLDFFTTWISYKC